MSYRHHIDKFLFCLHKHVYLYIYTLVYEIWKTCIYTSYRQCIWNLNKHVPQGHPPTIRQKKGSNRGVESLKVSEIDCCVESYIEIQIISKPKYSRYVLRNAFAVGVLMYFISSSGETECCVGDRNSLWRGQKILLTISTTKSVLVKVTWSYPAWLKLGRIVLVLIWRFLLVGLTALRPIL